MNRVVRGPRLPRRTFLRGVGAAIALPLLDAMVPGLSWAAEDVPRRLVLIFVPNGKHMQAWTPLGTGADYRTPSLLEPLAAHRADFTVLTGLTHDGGRAHGDGPGDHARAAASFLTGAHPRKTGGKDLKAGISVDQVAAQRVGRATRFPSLELGIERGAQAGQCDSGYSCAYVSNISWRTESSPLPKEVHPRLVFERLFGGEHAGESAAARARRLAARRSLLDSALEDARRLESKLGPSDRRKLDEFLTGIREIERRIELAESEGEDASTTLERPTRIPADRAEHIRLMFDLLTVALESDLTRVATFMMGNGGSNRSYPSIGIREGHHNLSHHGNDPVKQAKIRKINKFHVSQLAYLLDRMKAAKSGSGTLLQRSMVVYGSSISDGNRHNHDNLPFLLAGHGGGSLRPGRHVRFPVETPASNLFLSLLDRMNVRVSRFGDSTGRLPSI